MASDGNHSERKAHLHDHDDHDFLPGDTYMVANLWNVFNRRTNQIEGTSWSNLSYDPTYNDAWERIQTNINCHFCGAVCAGDICTDCNSKLAAKYDDATRIAHIVKARAAHFEALGLHTKIEQDYTPADHMHTFTARTNALDAEYNITTVYISADPTEPLVQVEFFDAPTDNGFITTLSARTLRQLGTMFTQAANHAEAIAKIRGANA